MTKTSSIRPGRIYTFVYEAAVDMVAKRDENKISAEVASLCRRHTDAKGLPTNKLQNPLADLQGSVTVRRVTRAQAAGNKTYSNIMKRDDPTWEPSGKPTWFDIDAENSCILIKKSDPSCRYLRALPIAVDNEVYLIGGKPVDEKTADTIRAFKEGSRSDVKFLTLAVDNLSNLQDDGGEEE